MNVFITGASSGIGAALAEAFARRGARLGLVARRGEALQALAEVLPASAGAHLCYDLDVTDKDALIAAALAFESTTGGADIVIANAGISVGVLTEHYEDLDAMRTVFETNLFAMATTFHPFIAPMRRRKRGTLVGMASVAGVRGLPGSEAYCASKAAAISYCESLRVELRSSGIRVVTLAPGFVRTPLTAANPYAMPFLIDARTYAASAVKAILAQRSWSVTPWQMAWVARVLRLLPNAVFDRLLGRRPYKLRDDQR